MIPIIVLYGVGMFFTALVGGFMFAASYGPNDPDRVPAAKILLGSPLWPLLWIKGIVGLIVKAKMALVEDQEKEES